MMCIICGNSEDEVRKLFCFPTNLDRCNKWQLSMGMVPNGVLSTSFRICDNHFTEESFIPRTHDLRLRRDAIPTIRPGQQVQETTIQSHKDQDSQIDLSSDKSNIPSPAKKLRITPVDNVLSNKTPDTTIDRTFDKTPDRTSDKTIDRTFDKTPDRTSDKTTDRTSDETIPQIPIQKVSNTPTSNTFEDEVILSDKTGRQIQVGNSAFPRVTVRNLGNLSPMIVRERFLRSALKSTISELRKEQRRQNFGKVELVKYIDEVVPEKAATFLLGQVRQDKELHPKTWSLDEKIMSLALYNLNPDAYEVLRQVSSVPSQETLQNLLKDIDFEVGINENVFKHIGECLGSFEEENRFCTLAFHEMEIHDNLQYSNGGFEDLGNGQIFGCLARHALVFMLQGFTKDWKQPLAYYFTQDPISPAPLETILRKILFQLCEVNIPVIATICSMRYEKTLQNMGVTISDPYFVNNGQKIYAIYDVPHLLKSTRNLFRRHNVVLPALNLLNARQILEAKWSDIIQTYEDDKKSPEKFRWFIGLKESDLESSVKIDQKVYVAGRTMGRKMLSHMAFLVRYEKLPWRALATATFLSNVDQMFDSLNGKCEKHVAEDNGKPYRCMVSKKSGHLKFWEECYENVEKWKFIGKGDSVPDPWTSPPQRGWMLTLKAFIGIRKDLNSLGVRQFKPRSLNLDALENLFGCLRVSCDVDENPTVTQFVTSLKSQIVNGLTNDKSGWSLLVSKRSNCEKDDFKLLTNLRSLLSVEKDISDG